MAEVKRTLTTYIISEIVPPFLLGLLTFTLVLLLARIVKLVEMVVTRGVPLWQVGKLFGLIAPTFLEMTVPMALLLGVFLGLGRLSGDYEIVALKSSGVSPKQILFPVLVLALATSCLTLAITTAIRPSAYRSLKKELYRIGTFRLGSTLQEKVFHNDFPKVLIYVEEIVPPGDTFQGVLIVDRREPELETITFGKVGFYIADEETQTIGFRLVDGTIYERDPRGKTLSQTHFNSYGFKVDLDEAAGLAARKERGPKEMSLRRLVMHINQLEAQGRKPSEALLEFHQRFSHSFAPFIFSLLAVALVLLPRRSRAGRHTGFTQCLFWLLAYYTFLSIGMALGEEDIIAPIWGAWLPNLVVGGASLYLFRKAVQESPLWIQQKWEGVISQLQIQRRGNL